MCASVWGLSAGHRGQHGRRGRGRRRPSRGRRSTRGEGRGRGVSAEAAAQEEAAEKQDELHTGADRGTGERSGQANTHIALTLQLNRPITELLEPMSWHSLSSCFSPAHTFATVMYPLHLLVADRSWITYHVSGQQIFCKKEPLILMNETQLHKQS